MSSEIVVSRLGGPEVLECREAPESGPGVGEVALRQTAIGVNYIDVYFRTGLYPGPKTPFTPGVEAVGVIEELGEGVQGFQVGQRVGYAGRPLGAYAERRCLPARHLIPLPGSISDEDAAAVLLKGMTAHVLLHRVRPIEPQETLLIHAAAGGVGTLLCQWASCMRATVIGMVGTEEKRELALENGCRHALLYTDGNWPERVRELAGGVGVHVVYDSVGADTFQGSLDCLAPLGTMVSFGNASGPPPSIEVLELARRGSLHLTRPSLMDYTAERGDLLASASALFDAVESGIVRPRIGARWPLADAASAHLELESRRTFASTLLVPQA